MGAATPRIDRLPFLVALLSAAAIGATPWFSGAGCASDPSALGDGEPSAASSGGAADANKGRVLFEALEPDFIAACSECHEPGGLAVDAPFLAGPDRYQTIRSWPGIVRDNPSQSLLLTFAVTGGGHPGPMLDGKGLADTLLPRVKEWLGAEAAAVGDAPGGTGPSIEPFAPIEGFNAVYLDVLGDAYKGMALTFTASKVADGETALELDDLEVHPTADVGVHLVHPLFVVFPLDEEADPDPVDSFSNVDQRFAAGASGSLGPGRLILTNWRPDAKLSVAFESIEPLTPELLDGGVEGGTSAGGCKALGEFEASAKPQFKARCVSCHGNKANMANAAIDMSKLDSDAAAACAQIKNRIDPTSPGESQIFVTTNPQGNAAHPFKFDGNAGAYGDFKDTVTAWITAEK